MPLYKKIKINVRGGQPLSLKGNEK